MREVYAATDSNDLYEDDEFSDFVITMASSILLMKGYSYWFYKKHQDFSSFYYDCSYWWECKRNDRWIQREIPHRRI